MSTLENESVKKVRAALIETGVGDNVIELEETARSAEEAAKSLGVELGSIVKSLVFLVDEQPVMALVAGDHTCKPDALPRALNLEGEVKQCDADQVRAATGFAIGGVAPVALAQDLPTLLDVSLKRFDTVYAAAGHPNCVFATSVSDLKRLTGCIVSYAIAEPA
mgnify:CR=1 FL=1|jgi:prolyl-tRNA editing enzyme YbaK/EbsC (Cys-tRNA(Pro) deacylase)